MDPDTILEATIGPEATPAGFVSKLAGLTRLSQEQWSLWRKVLKGLEQHYRA